MKEEVSHQWKWVFLERTKLLLISWKDAFSPFIIVCDFTPLTLIPFAVSLSSSVLQWEIVQTVVNGTLFYTYSVCSIETTEQDNWLRTTFIQRRPGTSRVSVELSFVVRDCNTFGGASVGCKETFNLFISEADADVGTNFRKGQFRKVATIAPDEVTQGRVLKVNTETKTVGPLSKKGFYLGFQDVGACVALLSVRVYYKTCPSTVQSLAVFPETVADALRQVEGACVENAVSQATPRIYCTAEGKWVVPMVQCQCLAGYEATGDSCQGKHCQKYATLLSETCLCYSVS